MTGFGASETENDNWRIRTEIKSLNNKFLELNLRLPKSFKDREIELRQLLTFRIGRGSVSVSVTAEKKDNTAGDSLNINLPLAKAYKDKLENMARELQIATPDLWNSIMTLPDVIKYEESEGLDEDWELIKGSVETAFQHFDKFRLQEGKTTGLYLKECIDKISLNLLTVEKEEIPRRESIKGRLMQSLADNKEDVKVDNNRFEQEIIYYLEKYDIAEEKSRLRHHLNFFLECLENEANGKKLNFISQEMGREINTLGSKAYFFPIQQAVVFMKEELEKIKEQLLNVL
jgi:uncharacterized protein (TIGR00255 family)